MSAHTPGTPLEALVTKLRACDSTPGDAARPAAILWPDPARQWSALSSLLSTELPELLVLGDYAPEKRTGPAIWLRCLIDRALDEPALPTDRPPIVLLPGVARQELRAGEGCPPALQPLVELMYRGTLWLQRGGHDWTVSAFLTSEQALGLDMAKDDATRDALLRALPEIAVTPLAQLRGRRLEAEDFDRLLSSDVIRDVLRWMSDPDGTRERLGDNGWGAFGSLCREKLDFDPDIQADVTAGELVGCGEGAWGEVWERFTESPGSYPGIESLLQRSRPAGTLPFARESWPDLNEQAETEVRGALGELPRLSHERACKAIVKLDESHGKRREWVWARMDRSPMAAVLEPLCRLAGVVPNPIAGTSLEEIASVYVERGWQADAAAWEAVALSPTADEQVVGSAVRHLLLHWLDESARAFQSVLEKGGLPTPAEQGLVRAGEDGCVLFADGLRYDLGQRLAERLEGRGMRVTVRSRWAAAPTVTATAKPGVTPVADLIRGEALTEDFGTELAPNGLPADARNLRAAMQQRDYQILGTGSSDAPQASPAKGWVEAGDIDTLGHKVGGRLARQLSEELERLCNRIAGLLDGGWKTVQVVTDHGWLLLPGGLPKVDLPKHLTASRWARCAVISGGSQPDVPRYPWTWNPAYSFAFAPGVACFNKTEEYAHGGLSIQECLTPDLLVEYGEARQVLATIDSVTWRPGRSMRCDVQVTTRGGRITADIRLGSPQGASVVFNAKLVEKDGETSLLVEGDEHEDADLVLVLLDDSGQILAQKPTRVGANS